MSDNTQGLWSVYYWVADRIERFLSWVFGWEDE